MHDIRSSAQSAGASLRWLAFTSGLFAILLVASLPASAQTSSPDIIAKERKDPAAGEVVIINRKKRKAGAPDPYSPIKLKPLPEKWSEQSIEQRQPAKTAAPKPIEKNDANEQAAKKVEATPKALKPVESARNEPDLIPPLPTLNAEQRSASARLWQFPQADLNPVPRPLEGQQQPRRRARPTARDRAEWRRYRDRRRFSNRQRSWRQCRRLARRCNAGFEGSCIIWERRC